METILVCVIVAVVLLLSARSLYRMFAGKGGGCGCGADTCPAADSCEGDAHADATQGEKRIGNS